MRGLLLYNENKVTQGKADLILANRFGTELENLDFGAKLTRFKHLISQRPNVKTHALHIMLNFDRADKLDIVKLQQISGDYMNHIGFGDQPYLVYQHKDVSHPHLHIVTTNITSKAKRIDIHGIGWQQSEIARKELETKYNLIKAEGRNKSEALAISPINIEKALYGEIPTKRAINNVVSAVMRTYKFTSFAEYNAILKQFGVVADRGKQDSIMFEKRGLVYSIIDEKGKRLGIPFKASELTERPVLNKVEKKFERSKEIRKTFKENLKERIELVLNKYDTITKRTFVDELQKQKIALVFRQNEKGQVYGITFVDHRTKCVFNGSDLGKAYSAKGLMETFSIADKAKSYLCQLPKTNYLQKEQSNKNSLHLPEPSNFLDTVLGKVRDEPIVNTDKRKKRRKGKNSQQESKQNL